MMKKHLARLTIELETPIAELIQTYKDHLEEVHRDIRGNGVSMQQWARWQMPGEIQMEATSLGASRCILKLFGMKLADCEAFARNLPGGLDEPSMSEGCFLALKTGGFGIEAQAVPILPDKEVKPLWSEYQQFQNQISRLFKNESVGFSVLCSEDHEVLGNAMRTWVHKNHKEQRIYRTDEPGFHAALGTQEGIEFWIENAGPMRPPAVLLVEGGEGCFHAGACMDRTLRRNLLGLRHGLLVDILRLHVILAINLPKKLLDPTLIGSQGALATCEICSSSTSQLST